MTLHIANKIMGHLDHLRRPPYPIMETDGHQSSLQLTFDIQLVKIGFDLIIELINGKSLTFNKKNVIVTLTVMIVSSCV